MGDQISPALKATIIEAVSNAVLAASSIDLVHKTFRERMAARTEITGEAVEAISAALREGHLEGDDEPELPAGGPITEEASDAAVRVAQAIERAIQVRGIFSYAPDGRPCLTWYGEQRIGKVIDTFLEGDAVAGAEEMRERCAANLEAEAARCIADIVPNDEIGRREANARAGALMTSAADLRALPAKTGGRHGE